MNKLFFIPLILVCNKAYAITFDASFNVNAPGLSIANVRMDVRDIAYNIGFYAAIRGLGNGINSSDNIAMYDKINEIKFSFDGVSMPELKNFDMEQKPNEFLMNGAAFGVTYCFIKYIFVGAAFGYCDIVKTHKITLNHIP
jgi:hypothetical protein